MQREGEQGSLEICHWGYKKLEAEPVSFFLGIHVIAQNISLSKCQINQSHRFNMLSAVNLCAWRKKLNIYVFYSVENPTIILYKQSR